MPVRSTAARPIAPAPQGNNKRSTRSGLLVALLPLAISLFVLAPLTLSGFRRDAVTLSAGPSVTVAVVADGMRFSPAEIRVPARASVQVDFANRDVTTPHDFQTLGQYRDARVVLWPGEERTTGFIAAEKPGRYAFICTVRGHKEAGMVGVIIVEPADAS
ncbi:MAG TPA: cupredoxin domain-containing protein [Chloroflexota bacterium]|nr:cupredoxin domain-containing protein [Chloroflexota bacterium]